MNYAQSTQWLESLEVKMSGFTLETIESLCILSGINPTQFKTVHVAGSNGKGSTCAFISQILTNQGHKTGFYSSPHLAEYTERIKINGKDISKEKFGELAQYFRELSEKNRLSASQFEILTAIAFKYFREEKIDFLVAEVGLGGRLDATNVLKGEICIITSLSPEHTQYLGSTIEKIAYEKAGIIKENSKVLVYGKNPGLEVIKRTAEETKGAQIKTVDFIAKETKINGNIFDLISPKKMANLKTGLIGSHQIENASLAAAAMLELKENGVEISEQSIRKGLECTFWPCRLEVIAGKPAFVLDAAHNPDGWEKLFESLKMFQKRPVIVFAAMKDKDVSEFGRLAQKSGCSLILTQIDNPRCESAKALQKKIGFGKAEENPLRAIWKAKKAAGRNGFVAVTGSIYFLGKIYGKI